MKKLTMLLLSLVMVFGFAACRSGTPSGESGASQEMTNSSVPDAASSLQSENNGNAESRTLVVYFSATGNTEQVANYIANTTGGDLFALEPVNPYTNEDLNWTVDGSRVNLEHEDESLRDIELVADTVENWDSYDTVFIGYPIWWGIAAWPVDGFVKANDFTGKTVIPFCTSTSSGLGESGELLAELTGTGDWLEGVRFRSGASEADVQEWLDSLEHVLKERRALTMKRLLAVLSVMAVLFSLAACISEDAGHFSLDAGSGASQAESSDNGDREQSGGNVLIAYDSAREGVAQAAEILADALSGDLLEVENDSGLQADAYEYVLLGFALEGDALPQAIETFLQRHDFGARTIYPFVLGGSDEDVVSLAGLYSAISQLQPGSLMGEDVLTISTDTTEDAVPRLGGKP